MNEKIVLTWNDFDCLTKQIIKQVTESEWKPDVIVGIVRGGAVPATVLSHSLNIKCVNFTIAFRDFETRDDMSSIFDWANVFSKNILIVDDINDTGTTISYIKKMYNTKNTKFATLIHNASSSQMVNYFGKLIDKSEKDLWVVFPWEPI
jgi:hypoxanthine phosphoribosyltransferase